ncbi:hypothetical protein [Teredinibacter sp. KSP-S5-2]|uniref:hypothetical protein n=1 Tax=Teredinibacter sp. KSP-S5-2 TaxID=3034506 RepID=UPI00293421A5|nr:hypothetical protein [Teredinibacter sp. KSP-S5-2]WNO11651.1 hypothetical protein P5V12_10755 [Teredinibacter sp. KSP-S5-2]
MLASKLTVDFRRREDCISYLFNQSFACRHEFILFEEWENQPYMDAHITALVESLGTPAPGEALPEKILSIYESAKPEFYRTIV